MGDRDLLIFRTLPGFTFRINLFVRVWGWCRPVKAIQQM